MTSLIYLFKVMSLLQEAKEFLNLSDQDTKLEVNLKKKGNVYFLLLNKKANVFNKTFVREIHRKLDQVESNQGPTALVTLSLNKIYSAGMDLNYVSSLERVDARYFVLELIALFGRMIILPFPTLTLVKGPAIAGGCMLAFSHDIVNVAKNALFACSQVDLGMPLPPGMNAVVKRKHNKYQTFRDMVIFGRKFNQKESLSEGIVDEVYQQNSLSRIFDKAEKLSSYGENKLNYKKLKEQMYKETTDACFNHQHAVGVKGQISITPIPKL